MRVRFKAPFFAMGPTFKRNGGQAIKGQLFPKGVHEVPEGTELPKSAVILDKSDTPLPVPKRKKNLLHEHDLERAAGDDADAARERAEFERLRPKRKPGRPKKYA